MSGADEATVTRARDPLQGQRLPVLRRWRRQGGISLLVMLPDGSKRLLPREWTDDAAGGATDDADDDDAASGTLGRVEDLLAASELVAAFLPDRSGRRAQAARTPSCEEEHHAACTAEPMAHGLSHPSGDDHPRTARGRGRRGDPGPGRPDRQERRRSAGAPDGDRR
ncbi:MAG TPA: DUF5372 family protein [Pseudonocardiaceae bacterium]